MGKTLPDHAQCQLNVMMTRIDSAIDLQRQLTAKDGRIDMRVGVSHLISSQETILSFRRRGSDEQTLLNILEGSSVEY